MVSEWLDPNIPTSGWATTLNSPPRPNQTVPKGPGGRTFDEVTGTDYTSAAEREWYLREARNRGGGLGQEATSFLSSRVPNAGVGGAGGITDPSGYLGFLDSYNPQQGLSLPPPQQPYTSPLDELYALPEADRQQGFQDYRRAAGIQYDRPAGPALGSDTEYIQSELTRRGALIPPEERQGLETAFTNAAVREGSNDAQLQYPQGNFANPIGSAINLARTEIPYAEEAARAAGQAGRFLGEEVAPRAPYLGNIVRGYNMLANQLGAPTSGDIGQFAAETAVPREAWELGLEAVPGIGLGPDLLRGINRSQISDVIRRGGRNLIDSYRFPAETPQFLYHGTTTGRVGDIAQQGLRPNSWLGIDPSIAEATARRQAMMRGEAPAVLRFPISQDQVQRARTTFLRQPAFRANESLFGGQARLATGVAGGADEALTARRALQPGDPGYGSAQTLADIEGAGSLSDVLDDAIRTEGVYNPSRYVITPEGGRATPNPQNLAETVQRMVSGSSIQAKINSGQLPNNPAAIADEILKSPWRKVQGRSQKMVEGVSRAEIMEALGASPEVVNVTRQVDEAIAKIDNVFMRYTGSPRAAENLMTGNLDNLTDEEIQSLGAAIDGGGAGGSPPTATGGATPPGGGGADKIRKAKDEGWDAGRIATEILGIPRAAMATADISRLFRQDITLLRHAEWRRNIGEMMRMYVNPAYADDVEAGIRANPWFEKAKERGLYIAERGDYAKREEDFASTILGEIPGYGRLYKGAEAAFSTGGNKLRMDMFARQAQHWADMGLHGDKLDRVLKDYASYLNYSTGRGALPKGTPGWLTMPFFAPRFLLAKPQLAIQLVDPRTSRYVRYEILKDISTSLGAMSSLLGLATLAGATVELDPRSSDFGKAKFGNQRIDLTGGWSTLVRQLYQMGSGEVKSTSGAIRGASLDDLLLRYARFKLSPSFGMAWSLADEETALGEPFGLNRATLERTLKESFIPLFAQDIFDAAREEGTGRALATLPATFFGIGSTTYPPSAGVELNQLIADKGLTDPTTGQPITEWFKLDSGTKRNLREQDPEIDALLTDLEKAEDGITAQFKAGAEEAWQNFQKHGDPDRYKEEMQAVKDAQGEAYAAAGIPELKNPGDFAKKTSDFFDQMSQVTDPDQRSLMYEEFEESLNPKEAAAFKEMQLSSPDPNYETFKRAENQLFEDFYGQRDTGWKQLQQQFPELQDFDTYGDVFAELPEGHYLRTLAGAQMAQWEDSYLAENPELEALLVFFGHRDEISPQGAEILDAFLQEMGFE